MAAHTRYLKRAEKPGMTGSKGAMSAADAPNLYQLIRETLTAHGGCCKRDDLIAKINSDRAASRRLESSQGFDRLLENMKHSGFILLDGEIVRATGRRVGKRRL